MLEMFEELLNIPEEQRSEFKITHFLRVYDELDEVSKRFVLKSWFGLGILAPDQKREVQDLLEGAKNTVEPAIFALCNIILPSEPTANRVRATTARGIGEILFQEQKEPEPYVDGD